MGGEFAPALALEIGEKLRGDETHLGGQLGGLLAGVGRLWRELGIEHDDRFGAEQTVLGTTKAQDVYTDVGRQRGERHVECGGGIGEARTIDMQQ